MKRSTFSCDSDTSQQSASSALLLTGRRSFGNFNPIIDSLHDDVKKTLKQQQRNENKEAVDAINDKSVTDDDMVTRYTSFIGLTGNKTQSLHAKAEKVKQRGQKRARDIALKQQQQNILKSQKR